MISSRSWMKTFGVISKVSAITSEFGWEVVWKGGKIFDYLTTSNKRKTENDDKHSMLTPPSLTNVNGGDNEKRSLLVRRDREVKNFLELTEEEASTMTDNELRKYSSVPITPLPFSYLSSLFTPSTSLLSYSQAMLLNITLDGLEIFLVQGFLRAAPPEIRLAPDVEAAAGTFFPLRCRALSGLKPFSEIRAMTHDGSSVVVYSPLGRGGHHGKRINGVG
ncbi:hypothetical protein BDP27DRAFT_1370998 [Rhodocollybia butyracea]|uniref:Uncharacterized protein n=1 Tax=Rhodocollybia butyracea TaxID=206335 RepID=A0A9P5TXX4_9AGAR|nr:hypothetical protein BDP27DRAFT_1370998 [Rhodocollybia butyracea]